MYAKTDVAVIASPSDSISITQTIQYAKGFSAESILGNSIEGRNQLKTGPISNLKLIIQSSSAQDSTMEKEYPLLKQARDIKKIPLIQLYYSDDYNGDNGTIDEETLKRDFEEKKFHLVHDVTSRGINHSELALTRLCKAIISGNQIEYDHYCQLVATSKKKDPPPVLEFRFRIPSLR